jgi:hypothetical protein
MIYILPPSTSISRGSKRQSRFATLPKFPSSPFLPSVGTMWMSLSLASLRGFPSPQAAARPPRRHPLARLPASPLSSFSSVSPPPCPPLASPAAGSSSSSFYFSPSGGRIYIFWIFWVNHVASLLQNKTVKMLYWILSKHTISSTCSGFIYIHLLMTKSRTKSLKQIKILYWFESLKTGNVLTRLVILLLL